MVRESNYRVHEELKATRQRPYAPPEPPPRPLLVRTVALWAVAVLAAAGAYSFWRELAEFFGRIG